MRVAPRDNSEVSPHPGTMRCNLLMINNPYIYNSNNSVTKKDIPQADTYPQGVETPTPLADSWLAGGWGSWNQRTARVTPRHNAEVPSHPRTIRSHPLIRISCTWYISTTRTTRGRKQIYPALIPPRKVWKPPPHWLIYGWLEFMKSACDKSCPSGQR